MSADQIRVVGEHAAAPQPRPATSSSRRPAYLDLAQIPPISELFEVSDLGAWTPVRITAAGRVKPAPPAILGLLYEERRHVLLGPYGVAKTMFLAWAAAGVMKRGGHVLWISVDGGHIGDLLERFLSFGVTEEQLDHQLVCFEHVDAIGSQRAQFLRAVVAEHDIELAVIDSSMGSMAAQGLDPNIAVEVERWWAEFGDIFKGTRTAVVLVDHSGNSVEAKKRASGSHRKQDAPDVVLRLAEKTNLYRGSPDNDAVGETRIFMEKDRPGFHRVRRGTQLAVVSFTSHCVRETEQDDDGKVTVDGEWTLTGSMEWGDDSTVDPKTGKKRLTVYMERVSTYTAPLSQAVSKRAIADNVSGTDKYIYAAIDSLEAEGFLAIDRSTQTHLVTHLRTYTQATDPILLQERAELYADDADDDA
jgi:hypothetical protein